MSPEQMFSLANSVALLAWIVLAAMPRNRWITNVATAVAVPGVFAGLYIFIVVAQFGRSQGGFSSLPDVALLFSNPWMLLAGWIHYLAFDLLVGSWEARDARESGVSHALLLPCLALTFLFGPAGWLLYQGVRRIGRSNTHRASAAPSLDR
jgi:hypothetical protein